MCIRKTLCFSFGFFFLGESSTQFIMSFIWVGRYIVCVSVGMLLKIYVFVVVESPDLVNTENAIEDHWSTILFKMFLFFVMNENIWYHRKMGQKKDKMNERSDNLNLSIIWITILKYKAS